MNRDRGLVAAALTPRGKRGELNFGACFDLLDHLCRANLKGIALLTAAGEYPAFTIEERTRLVYLGAKRARAPVLAGVGAEDLATSVELAREALAAGAEAVILPPPLLFDYPPEEVREFYLQFAAQMGRGTEIWIDRAPSPDQLTATGHFAGVVGDGLILSAEACAIPELTRALDCARRTANGRSEELGRLALEFQAWADRLPPLVAVRSAITLRGIAMGSLPIPLSPQRQPELEEFREWFRRWLPVMNKTAANA